ncbi:hypothetical protein ACFQX4_20170 [Roseomonas sp. GCM10028921]
MRQTRHRAADVALGYLRPANVWRNSPTQRIWTTGKPGEEVRQKKAAPVESGRRA